MSQNISLLSGRKGLENNLFERISETGLDQEGLAELAGEFLVGNAVAYGAASFYDFLNPENAGKKAFVCAGSACLLAGTQAGVRAELEQQYAPSEIGEVYCLGRCYENGAFHCHGKNFSGTADTQQIPQIVKNAALSSQSQYTMAAAGTPVLTAEKPDLQDCLRLLPELLQRSPESLLEQLEISGLRGRGGAGFPMHIKLAAVRRETADQKYIVCNADEGDPGAFSDRYILEERPHLLMLGMILAGYMSGAREGVVYIRAEYPEAIDIARKVGGWFNAQFPLRDASGSDFSFKLYVVKAQGAYICGEETALLNSLEGQRPVVRTRPPFPVQSGLYGRPTAVNNVETLANLPFICTQGGAAYKALGTAKSSGTKLLSLDSHFHRPGLYEVDMGTPLAQVVHNIGGGFRVPVKAMHIGGPLGGLVPVSKINDLTVDFESFAANGFLLGHASILCIPESFPLIQYLEHLFAFTAHESCGKCFPCRLGSTRGKELLQKAQQETYRIDRHLFQDLLETLEKGSLCALGGGLPLPVKNALHYFPEELGAFFK
jgi:NADH:ubiquinone oxidoreductase subunit F (NADH-binding)